MIDNIVNDENIVKVCMFRDAIKVGDEYVYMPKKEILSIEKEATALNYMVSHGVCPTCYQRMMDENNLRKGD